MQDAPNPTAMPDAASLAAVRAWYAGASSREAVMHYCPDALGGGRSARGVLGQVRRRLAELARQRHRDDLVALFLCDAAQRTRHAKSVARALETLRSLPIPEPQVSDAIDLWLPARAAMALRAHGIATLADLTVRIPRRRRWWAAIDGLGVRSARHIEAFFAEHPKLTERARALVAATPPEWIVPWEQIRLPHGVDGTRGVFRAPQDMCALDTGNDYEAIGAWLALHESAETQRAYRKEAERLLLWSIAERGKALSSLTAEDATAYRAFLRRPAPHQRWVAPARPRTSPEWRPFTGGLSARSIAYALSVLSAMFRWLIQQRYVLANPFAGLKVRGGQRGAGLDASRAFSAGEWELTRAIADGLEWSYGWTVPAAQRLRFLLDFGYATGLRAGELVGVTLGGIEIGARGERWLHLVGKGAKPGKVALPPLARHALDQYLMQRGLPVTPTHWKPDTPLLTSLEGSEAITSPRLRSVLRRFFVLAADTIQADHPALANKLRRATPHWMRHTHATHALAQGATLTTVRDNLRHASITTTSIYLHDDEVQRSRQLEQAFSRR
ncbi:MAG: phage integrase family protein [Ralstonia pickettii]|uniref:phage integrase family protein n=1 Tax=Ralstonia mannitolilytica TaxID=105219 RepID=UPI000CEF5861|nr:phage integrase family protein [Ralstonia mannitolilytica]CAJ0743458.1 Tyrosine recombinase XerC [Ralstonia mannitolilytica]